MSVRKACLVVMGFLLIFVFVVVLFVGCSVEKTVPKDGTMGVIPSSTVVQEIRETEKVVETVVETETESEDVIKKEGYAVNEESLNTDKENEVEGKELVLKPASDISVVNRYSSDVLISGKNIYLLDDSIYAYSLKMVLPIEGEGLQVVDYMCSVATWNSVESGESITVEYGIDSKGKVAILSLSK